MPIYFSSELIYTNNIHLPHDHNPVLPEILENHKFYPFSIVWGCTYHWSSHLVWEVLYSRCKTSHLWTTHPYQGDCYHLTEWGHAQLWHVFDSSSCTFWLVKNTLSPPTKISYSTANIHLHTMSLNVYKNTTSRFCYIHLRSPQLFSSICLLPLQHCMVLFVTSFAPTSITFKKLWT